MSWRSLWFSDQVFGTRMEFSFNHDWSYLINLCLNLVLDALLHKCTPPLTVDSVSYPLPNAIRRLMAIRRLSSRCPGRDWSSCIASSLHSRKVQHTISEKTCKLLLTHGLWTVWANSGLKSHTLNPSVGFGFWERRILQAFTSFDRNFQDQLKTDYLHKKNDSLLVWIGSLFAFRKSTRVSPQKSSWISPRTDVSVE